MSNNWCETHSGLTFDYADTTAEMLNIEDIARGLAYEGRYSNQSNGRITVGEHSCHVCDVLPEPLKGHGLLHDGAEAMMRDIPKPLKDMIDQHGNVWSDIEDRIQALIYGKYCRPVDDWIVAKARIKLADMAVMKAEASVWMPNGCEHWPCLQGAVQADVRVCKWDELRSEQEFMVRFVKYCNVEG